MDRKKLLSQIISNGFEVPSEGIPCTTEHAKEGYALDYVIEGNTVSGDKATRNLLRYNLADATKTINGVTITDNFDGTFTANGTASKSVWYNPAPNLYNLSKGAYVLSGCPSEGSTTQYYMRIQANNNGSVVKTAYDTGNKSYIDLSATDFANISFIIFIGAGTVCDHLVFKPQFEKGTEATEFEPQYKYGVGDLTEDQKYKIPIVNGDKTVTLLLDASIKSGESVRYTSGNLPPLPLQENGNTVTVGTTVQPTNLTIKYRAKVK